jgi:predicted nucleic acid-binding protein
VTAIVVDCSLAISWLIETDADGWARATGETALIAHANDLTICVAADLELALRLGARLATFDKDLHAAAVKLSGGVLP